VIESAPDSANRPVGACPIIAWRIACCQGEQNVNNQGKEKAGKMPA